MHPIYCRIHVMTKAKTSYGYTPYHSQRVYFVESNIDSHGSKDGRPKNGAHPHRHYLRSTVAAFPLSAYYEEIIASSDTSNAHAHLDGRRVVRNEKGRLRKDSESQCLTMRYCTMLAIQSNFRPLSKTVSTTNGTLSTNTFVSWKQSLRF